MKIGDMLESKYIKQSDIGDEIKVVTLTKLTKVNVARDDEDAQYKWTLKFAEFEKPMVCNTTNLKRIAKALGDDSDGWIGQKMELYVDADIEFGGNIVGGLRLRGIKKSGGAGSRRSDSDVNKELSRAADDDFSADPPF